MTSSALLLLDLQNDFLHPKGAYGRAGQTTPAIAALASKLKPLAALVRQNGGVVGSTLFTLVPGRNGVPIISKHLKKLRPFLSKGDFAPNTWGQELVEELAPADFSVEKVAYSAFYMTRLEWMLRKMKIERLYCAGIVTNGGVASTVRDAHVREFDCVVLEDGCAAFTEELHRAAIEGLRPIAKITTIADAMREIAGP